jgi:hypothetical protein
VAELADAQDLGSCGLKTVEVQILSPAPYLFKNPREGTDFRRSQSFPWPICVIRSTFGRRVYTGATMNTSRLVGQTVEVKLDSVDTSFSAVVLGVESAGLWIHEGNVLEKIAASLGGAPLEGRKEPAVFLPFGKISWLLTETKESVYQKAR